MHAMILAAGLGTRLRPLTEYRAKPALPVQGRPVISLLLAVLAKHGVTHALINLHYLPETIRRAVEADHPESLEITWSEEVTPLGTGGGIRRAADFLRESEECLVLAGDMLLDLDFARLRAAHRASGFHVSLVLRDDDRGESFGTIGLDAENRVVRIGQTQIVSSSATSPEVASGLFTGVRFFSRAALNHWPVGETFEDLRDWLVPRMRDGDIQVGGQRVSPGDSTWEPVGTLEEYVAANLTPPNLPSLGGEASAWRGAVASSPDGPSQEAGAATLGLSLEPTGSYPNVISATATVSPGATIEGCVVWENESIPSGFEGRQGVYAGGRFHPSPIADRRSLNDSPRVPFSRSPV